MKKITFLSLLFVVFCDTTLLSQKQQAFEKSKIWLNGTPIISNNSKEEVAKELPKSYFNFNPTVILEKADSEFKNMLDEYFSLFVVFKSNPEIENTVFELTSKKYRASVSNTYANPENEIGYDRANIEKGVILSYTTKIENYSRKNRLSFKNFSDAMLQDYKGNQLMEVLYFPKILNPLEKEKIETYLSIKHGISLIGEKNYITNQNDTIWNFKNNKQFNNRITGIGKDSVFGLFQKQSANSQKDGLTIGLGKIDSTNHLNAFEIKNETFLLWGDNNKETLLRKKENSALLIMDRIWQTQQSTKKSKEKITTQIRIDKKAMGLQQTDKQANIIWLVINSQAGSKFDYDNAKYYKQSNSKDHLVYFDAIQWEYSNKESSQFTFVEAPEFFALQTIDTPDCPDEGDALISLKMVGGSYPYTIEVSDNANKITHTSTTDTYNFSLASGTYNVDITDNDNRSYTETITIEKTPNAQVSLAPVWHLNRQGEVVVIPEVESDLISNLQFEWHNEEGASISNQRQLTASQPGNYSLIVTSSSGCKKRIQFTIETPNSLFANGLKLYPNASNSYEPFTISFELKKRSAVTVSVFNTQGQLIKTRALSNIKNVDFQESIGQPGMYFVVVESNGIKNSFRLLIK